jgi:hypothetical protein
MRFAYLTFCAALVILLSGCVTGRRELILTVPATATIKNGNIVEAFDPAYADFPSNFSDNVGYPGLIRDAAENASP